MLLLIFVKFFFKKNLETKTILITIKWLVITYVTLGLINYTIGFLFYPDDYAFVDRATGPYAWAYWLMFFGACILPFTLLLKRLSSNIFYVLGITFLMKIGMYFERFTIIITSIHRDYLP